MTRGYDVRFAATVKPTPAAASQTISWSRFVIPIGWMLAIYLASDQPKLPSPSGIPSFDKIAHFGAYGLLATLWVRAFSATCRPGQAAVLAWFVASLFGVTDEFHQSFVPGRSIELADWIADSSGAAVAAVLYLGWPAYRRLLDLPLVRRPSPTTEAAAVAAAPEQQP